MTTNIATMTDTTKTFNKLLSKKLANEILDTIQENYYCELYEDVQLECIDFNGLDVYTDAKITLRHKLSPMDEKLGEDWVEEVYENEIKEVEISQLIAYEEGEEVEFNETQNKVLVCFLETHINKML